MGGRGAYYGKGNHKKTSSKKTDAHYYHNHPDQLMGYKNYARSEKHGEEDGFHLVTDEHNGLHGFVISPYSGKYSNFTSQVSKDGDSVLIRAADNNWFAFDRKSDGQKRFGLKLDRTHVVYGVRTNIFQGTEGYAPTYIRFDKKYYSPHEVKRPFEDMAEGNGLTWDQLKKLAIKQENYLRKKVRKNGWTDMPLIKSWGGLNSDFY